MTIDLLQLLRYAPLVLLIVVLRVDLDWKIRVRSRWRLRRPEDDDA